MLPHDILNFQYDSLACAAALGWDCVTIGEEQLELVQRDGELQFERGAGPVRRHVSSFDPDAFARRWLQAALNADA